MPTPAAILKMRAVVRRLLLLTLVPLVLTACSTGPASREDYERLYQDRCGNYGMNRPVYCDR